MSVWCTKLHGKGQELRTCSNLLIYAFIESLELHGYKILLTYCVDLGISIKENGALKH